MARRDALLRLHQRLLARRDMLRRSLAGELEDLRRKQHGDLSGDTADAAFDAGAGEISSQLAELEARELAQVERALARLKQGTYGQCEMCGKRIPVARLNALPYSTLCIDCQRDQEQAHGWHGVGRGGDWERVYDVERGMNDQAHVDLSALEMDMGGGAR